MDYYSSSSSSRGRNSYRGSSFRSRGDSYRGSRGSRGGSSRGRGGSYSSKYDVPSSKYSSSMEGSKYGSSSYSKYDDSYRRSESSLGREHRSDINELSSRKRERPDTYSSSQGVTRRHDDDEYRSTRYSGSSYTEHRTYEEPRVFKKPRTEFKAPSDYRVKEPLRVRTPRGRVGLRGGLARRARESFSRRRAAFSSTCASPSEILAIRRAKLLQNRKAKTTEKVEKKEEGEVEETPKPEKTTSENGEAKAEEAPKEELARTTFYGRPFMKLVCPHCDIKCVTFKEYNAHFNHSVHINAIKDKCTSLKESLAAMRLSQRESQKKADEEDLTSMSTRSLFCPICKLHFAQERATHQASELHKKLKEFLMPYCKICRIQFDSPMAHESHLCSLEHLRRKHNLEERDKRSSSGILDNFMVLDSVGSGDEVEEDEVGGASVERGEDLTLGVEYIRIYNVKYCGVCRVYLSHLDGPGKLKQHCQTKEHLKCYLRYGNEELLEKMKNDGSEAVKVPIEEAKSTDATKKEDSDEILEGDKLWDGLSELLDDAQPRVKSDDEDEEEGGRFDRFKSKEQKENGDLPVDESEAKEKTTNEEPTPTVAAET